MSAPSPVLELGATKSSHRWAELPGNWDRLNTRALFAADNAWGIPALPPARLVPARLVPYNSRSESRAAARPVVAGRPWRPRRCSASTSSSAAARLPTTASAPTCAWRCTTRRWGAPNGNGFSGNCCNRSGRPRSSPDGSCAC